MTPAAPIGQARRFLSRMPPVGHRGRMSRRSNSKCWWLSGLWALSLSACADPPAEETAQQAAPPAPDGAVGRIGDALVSVDLGGLRPDAAPVVPEPEPDGAQAPVDARGLEDAAGAPADGAVSRPDAATIEPIADAVVVPPARDAAAVNPTPDAAAVNPTPDAAADAAPPEPDAPVDPCVAAPPDCSAFDGPCVIGVCEAGTGACVARDRPDDTPCDDAEPCTTGDYCETGLCVPGAPTDCSGAGASCRVGACVPGMGCMGEARPDGDPCDDADPCTVGEVCGAGECGGGAGLDCRGLEGACAEAICDPAAGGCVQVPHPDGERCDDGATPCSAAVCAEGACGPLQPVDCAAVAGECGVGRCDPALGCVADPLPACAPCAGGAGLCDGAGACRVRLGAADDFGAPALGPAWTTGGDLPWTRVDLGGGNGGARSGDIGARQTTELSRVVELEAETALSFRYRVSSESGYDFFKFRVDGAEVVSDSGNPGWVTWQGTVAAGRHTLTFAYQKDVSIDQNDDRAEIDDVLLLPACAGAPSCRAAIPVTGGACLTCDLPDGLACAAGADPCQPGVCAAGACEARPRADCAVCGAGNEVCLAGVCGVYAQTTWDFEAGFPAGVVQAGDVGWRRVNGQVHGGAQSARSGAIFDNETSEMRIPVNLPAPGVMVAWVRTSTEGGRDWLYLRVDGAQIGRWAGTTEWTRVTAPLAAGAHTVTFLYEKDFSVASGTDAVWVDDVSFTTGEACP
jgi:hypothetical protein